MVLLSSLLARAARSTASASFLPHHRSGSVAPLQAAIAPKRRDGSSNKEIPFSTLIATPSPLQSNKRDRDNENSNHQHALVAPTPMQMQTRQYHATHRKEIVAPFIPEMILFVIFSGGWYIYRKKEGKPLTPDEALEAQDKYRKEQERLSRQRQEYEQQKINE